MWSVLEKILIGITFFVKKSLALHFLLFSFLSIIRPKNYSCFWKYGWQGKCLSGRPQIYFFKSIFRSILFSSLVSFAFLYFCFVLFFCLFFFCFVFLRLLLQIWRKQDYFFGLNTQVRQSDQFEQAPTQSFCF